MHAASAASDMMMETKILMNLAPHPNICQIYGVTAAGSDAFLSRGKEGFYIILDRLSGTMIQKISRWKKEQQQNITSRQAKGEDEKNIAVSEYRTLMQRLEVALDIGSALLFLSDRQIVFHLRPDKVGYDVRYGRIKLCDFGQARENGQLDQAPSLTKTDDIRTLAYTAPEVLCQAPVTVAADVYSYGVMLWEMLTLHRPFEGMSRAEHFERVIMESERPKLLPVIPKAVQTLIEKCWDPHLRPTMKKVYDTVEEVLLFQDDKPEISVLPVLVRTTSEKMAISDDEANQTSKSTRRPLRRTRTSDAHPRPASGQKKSVKRENQNHHSAGSIGAPMKDKSKGSNHESGGQRASRKSRRSTSGHDEKNKTSGQEDGANMPDESKDSQVSAPMKDKSSKNQRVSRRSRTSKKVSEDAASATSEDRPVRRKSLEPPVGDAGETIQKLPAFGRSNTSDNASSGSKGATRASRSSRKS